MEFKIVINDYSEVPFIMRCLKDAVIQMVITIFAVVSKVHDFAFSCIKW